MGTTYVIENTAGTLSFSIQPGSHNGPGYTFRASDLILHGQGSLLWGAEANHNFYKLLENFSCPQKELNDYNPYGSPPSNNYDPATDPLLPKDENDLGNGKGITTPVLGQLWYNTTVDQAFIYDGSLWQSIGGVSSGTTAPTSAQPGDLWYDTSVPQLKVYNGSSFVSVANLYLPLDGSSAMTGLLTLSGDPTLALHAATKQYVDNTFVDVAGDTMTGFLTLNSDPTALLHAATKQYVDTEITSLSSVYVNVSGDTMTGFLTLNAAPTADLHAATKKYVDDQITSSGGGLGAGQTYQNLTGTRAASTTYTNSTGQPILVVVTGQQYASTSNWTITLYINGSPAAYSGGAVYEHDGVVIGVVDPGSTYYVTHPNGTNGIALWYELR